MKLIDWIKQVDPIVDVIIWFPEEEEPIFKGALLNIPWTLTEKEIGRKNQDDDEEPIYISMNENHLPVIVINLLDN